MMIQQSHWLWKQWQWISIVAGFTINVLGKWKLWVVTERCDKVSTGVTDEISVDTYFYMYIYDYISILAKMLVNHVINTRHHTDNYIQFSAKYFSKYAQHVGQWVLFSIYPHIFRLFQLILTNRMNWTKAMYCTGVICLCLCPIILFCLGHNGYSNSPYSLQISPFSAKVNCINPWPDYWECFSGWQRKMGHWFD